jgi:hypothetical protein
MRVPWLRQGTTQGGLMCCGGGVVRGTAPMQRMQLLTWPWSVGATRRRPADAD